MESNENMVTNDSLTANDNVVENDSMVTSDQTGKSGVAMPAVNRTFKSTVFIMLFEDKKNLLELYNAISGKHYTDPELLEINTLENAIYMSIKNDVSFLIDGRLSLYEHQSTYNPNLPLRFLLILRINMQVLQKMSICTEQGSWRFRRRSLLFSIMEEKTARIVRCCGFLICIR